MLERLQSEFLAAIRGAACNVALGQSAVSPEQTWRIYRRNYVQSHIAALMDTYSTVCSIVGEGYFRHLAGVYVTQSDSLDGDLNEYGADFPAFLDGASAAQELLYLADVARLDWAWLQMLRATQRLDDWLPQLLSLPPERWPAVRAIAGGVRIASAFPIFDIWKLAALDGEPVDLAKGGQTVLVTRPNEVEVNLLSPVEDAFVARWLGGSTLEEALECALSTGQGLDIGTLLTRMAATGAVQSIESTI